MDFKTMGGRVAAGPGAVPGDTRVKDLIAELQRQDPEALVGASLDASHYLSKVVRVYVEARPVSAPKEGPVVVVGISDENHVPADEDEG